MVLHFDQCTRGSKCDRCDIGYILKRYVKPLMQTLTNDIKEYYMKLLTTKCLNTAVMLSVFMLGRKNGIAVADYCDTEATRGRHASGQETSLGILESFREDIFDKRVKSRYLYYILLTDGKFPYDDASRDPAFFPGHVFLLEKVPTSGTEQSYFNFYQSYINQYDLNVHVKKNNNTLKISYERAKEIYDCLVYIFSTNTWDQKCVDTWKSFTFADTSYILGSHPQNNVFLCIKKSKITDCLKYIKEYTKLKLDSIEQIPRKQRGMIYGNSSLYDEEQAPLTVSQIRKKLLTLYNDISQKYS